MKYLIVSLLTFSCISHNMDTQEQLKTQLRDITFDGNYDTFVQQSGVFNRNLEYNDILHARQQCDVRLLALKHLKTMYADTRIKELFFTMQAEMKASNMGLFAYIDDAEKKYKQNDTPEQEHIFGTAAEILRSIEFHQTSYTGDYLIDLQTKIIAQALQPLEFIEMEIKNSTQLHNILQQILDDEFEPPKGLEYDKEGDIYFLREPERKHNH